MRAATYVVGAAPDTGDARRGTTSPAPHRFPRREHDVSEPFYVSRGRVAVVRGVHRRAEIAAGTQFDMGVHGPIKAHYRLDASDLPLPVDYIVAATGG